MTDKRVMTLIKEVHEKNLEELDLSVFKLRHLPNAILELKNLKELDLFSNCLTQLPPEIGELKNLTELYLSNNQLTQLPPEIGKLKNLTKLDISFNRLTQLPSEIGNLKNLTELYLSNNQLTELPPEIVELENLRELYLEDNPLTSPPPEIVSRGIESIFTYLKEPKTTENKEVKLLLVGDERVGKTCLAHRLVTGNFLEDSKITEGINVSKWKIPSPSSENSEINLNVWDFGGQEIYHATHQFFLTKRSVYLLLWNARKTKEKDFNFIYYWLYTIEAFGEDSPIIIVMSKMNESDDNLNQKDLKERFTQIVDSLKIDSKSGRGIPGLKECISETAWEVPLMKTKWIDSWFKVRQKLEIIEENSITYDKFCEICEYEGLNNKNIAVLDDYLHDLGVTLHFKDRLTLKNIVILKPEWATGAFYKILSTASIRNNEGIMPQRELSQIWDEETYPSSVHPQLMDLMNKFELSYELHNKSSYLIPELLPQKEPDNFKWNTEDELCFNYSYEDFLPPGIIPRFIVRMHQDIQVKENSMPLCWREGVVLNLQNSRALVRMNSEDKQIEVRVKGDNKRGAMGAICSQIDRINASMKKIKVSKQIPCNCSKNCLKKYSYNELLNAEINNVETITCLGSFKPVSVSSLLNGYMRRDEIIIGFNEKYGNTYISYGGIKVGDDNIHIHDVSGSVNVNSQLDHTVQLVNNVSVLAATQKKELIDLFEQLKKSLKPAENANPEKTKRVLRAANDVVEELSNKEPDKSYIKSATERLKETASTVMDIAPDVLPIATKIAAFVTGMF